MELTHKAVYAGKQGAFVGAGALLGLASVLTLMAALVLALGAAIALWLSALLVGLAVGAVAYAVLHKGITGLRNLQLKPEQTIQSLQENKTWAQRQIR